MTEEWLDILKFKKNKDIVPDRYSDIWREHYNELSHADQIEVANGMFDNYVFPNCEKENLPLSTVGTLPINNPIYENKNCDRFFDYVFSQKDSISVLELGGGFGNMARYILDKYGEKIKRWDNYELTTYALTKNQCNHSQYTAIVTSKFFWELNIQYEYDVFIGSHVIEHVTSKDAYKIFDKIKNIEFLYIECPIFDDTNGFTKDNNVNTFFGGNCGTTHILEIGFKQITDYLKKYNYVLLEELSKPYIIDTYDENKKLIRFKGRNAIIAIPDKRMVHLEGRGYVRYDDEKNKGASRVYKKR